MTVRVGFAKRDITPSVGCPLSGYSGREDMASSIDGPLEAHALAVRGDRQSVVMVSADLEDVDAAFVADVRNRATAAIDLHPRQRSPFPVTMVVSMANDSAQYMCTDHAIEEGGMEPGKGTNCNGPGTEAALVDSSLEMLGELRKGS